MEKRSEYKESFRCCCCDKSNEQVEDMIIINPLKKINICGDCVKLAYENLFGKNEPIKIDLEQMISDDEISNCGC
jgi:hypothetical protein